MSDLYLQLMDLETKLSTFIQSNETSNQTECEEMISNITLQMLFDKLNKL